MMSILFAFALTMSLINMGHGTNKQNSQGLRTMHQVFCVAFFLLALMVALEGKITCLL